MACKSIYQKVITMRRYYIPLSPELEFIVWLHGSKFGKNYMANIGVRGAMAVILFPLP
jgi:hypothetical protein